ncbi:MAG: hypothetical protein RLZZ362_2452, partial [Actinomycetota bacterium]
RDTRVVPVEVDGTTLTVWWQPGTSSALDEGDIVDGDDVGATGVFVPAVDGRALTFTADGEAFVDAETGSTWNVFGRAAEGPLAGAQLEQVAHLDTFWFAWAAVRPDSVVVPAETGSDG